MTSTDKSLFKNKNNDTHASKHSDRRAVHTQTHCVQLRFVGHCTKERRKGVGQINGDSLEVNMKGNTNKNICPNNLKYRGLNP